MFISVDLPAPFSPRRACTSPGRRSRSMWSLARTPGNCLVIPRSSRTSGVSCMRSDSRWGARTSGGGSEPAPVFTCLGAALLHRRLQLAGQNRRFRLLLRGPDGRGDLAADRRETDAPILEREEPVRAALERAIHGGRDRVVDAHVDLLLGAR